ncbi:MAG: PorT family protein [Flavobacteriaceae bacterium]|jgi:hypothetical protein|nr:PorT family protein [Flavobacteriaceae bacterium]
MKKTIILLALTICSTANAQFGKSRDVVINYADFDQQRYSWGFYLGVNYFDFKIHPNKGALTQDTRYLVVSDPKPGFSVSLFGKLRVDDYIDIRLEPTFHFTQRDLIFNNIQHLIDEDLANGVEPAYTDRDVRRNVKATYMDIPIFINFHGDRWNNTRPYVQGGLSWISNLQSNEKKEQDNKDQIFRLKTNNFSYQLEAGIEIYFKRFKLTPSIKGIFFFNNELVADNPDTPPVWAGALKSINSRTVMFSLKFE